MGLYAGYMDPLIRPEIDRHYSELFDESERLIGDAFNRLELIRTKEIIERYLPDSPSRILDVGGGPGVYSVWLAELGHEVELIDPVERHVEQALAAGVPVAHLGTAAALEYPDETFDHVLLLGPLYHLQERTDRLVALEEAGRVLKPGGLVFAAAITRFASAIDGLYNGFIDHDEFERIAYTDLETGRHINTVGDPRYFTTSYFHRPDELRDELEAAGFGDVELLAVEGVSWAAPDLEERVDDPGKLASLLDLMRRLETEPSLLGASPHFLGVGHR